MQRGKKSKMNNICFVLLLLVSLLQTLMAESGAADKSAATVHIVHMKPSDGQEKPEVHHIKTLAAVLGSEEAARKALVYHYTHAANGFAAKLTEKQALELTKLHDVIQVSPSRTLHLHSGLGRPHRMFNFP